MVRPLAARAKGLGFDSPIAQHVQRNISRTFTGIDLVGLGPRNLGSFPSGAFGFNYITTLGIGYVHIICLSSPSYSFFRGR